MLRPIKLRQYLSAMHTRGFDAKAVLAGSGITAEGLSSPGCQVDLEQCHQVVSNIIRLTGNKSAGFEIGRDSHLTDLGIIGYAMASARTLRQAIVIWLQHVNSPLGWPIRVQLVENAANGDWGISATPAGTPASLFAFYWEEVIALGFGFSRLFTGDDFRLKEIRFRYAAPPDMSPYEALFKCQLTFDATECGVTVESPRLDASLRGNDESVNELCLAHCGQVMAQTAHNGVTASRLRSLLLRSLGTFPTIADAASELGISIRTLRRRLTDEGTGYQEILDAFRRDLAQEYLKNGLKPKEIGFLLGFKHADAFRQAFKTWTGQKISDHPRQGTSH